ncbi:MAG: benzoate-CoA ligase family protein [Rhodospirillales bacterium]|nr:benzoate-CoA ligase family protein [Rhodospirillales bacterium]
MTLRFRRRKAPIINGATAILSPSLERGQENDLAIISQRRNLTYGELDKLSNRFANALVANGLKFQDRVILMISDRPAFIYTYLGIMKAGGVPVAINMRAAPDDLAYKLADSESKLLLTETQFHQVYISAKEKIETLPQIIMVDGEAKDSISIEAFMEATSEVFEPVPMKADDMAFWVYSSGTTGLPKAVVHNIATLLSRDLFMSETLGIGPGERVFCSSKLFFAFPLGHCFFSALQQGATTILYDGWSSSESITEMVEKYHPTVMFSVPTFYSMLLRDGCASQQVFKNIKWYVAAGESLPPSVFAQWIKKTGHPILEGIGATETIHMFLANTPGDFVPGVCGKPTPKTEVKLLDEIGEEVTHMGIPGVLWVKRDSIAHKYWNLEEKTTLAFKGRWYCTGDVFIKDAMGNFRHQGRNDDMLKISGQWVSPIEIENIVKLNPALNDAAVVGIPNADGHIRLALFLAPHDPNVDRANLETDIQDTLKANLSIYKCPRRFFYLDDLPRTATDKVQRYLLKQIATDQMANSA